jgi:flagellin
MSFKIDTNNVQYSNSSKSDILNSVNKVSNALRNKNHTSKELNETAKKFDEQAKNINNKMKNLDLEESDVKGMLKSLATSQINLKAAESQIKDIDFSQEVKDFKKDNILSQVGSYTDSQTLTQNKVKNLLK